MPVLDTLALAALESARALTSDLSPRSDSNNPFGRHCDNGVVLQLRHAPSTRRLGPRPKLTTVPMIIGLPPFFAQSESTWTSIFHLVILRLSLRPIVLTSPPSRILLALELTSSLAVLPCPRTSSAGSAFTVPLRHRYTSRALCRALEAFQVLVRDVQPLWPPERALLVPDLLCNLCPSSPLRLSSSHRPTHTHTHVTFKKEEVHPTCGSVVERSPSACKPCPWRALIACPWPLALLNWSFPAGCCGPGKEDRLSVLTCLTGTGLIGSVSWCCRDKKLPKRAVLSRVVKLLSGCAHLQNL